MKSSPGPSRPGLLRHRGRGGGILHGVGGTVKATADDGLQALEPIGRWEWNTYNVYNGTLWQTNIAIENGHL